MSMNKPELYLEMARRVCAGERLSEHDIQLLVESPDKDVFDLLPGADLIREHFWGKSIHLCAITNGKSGKCSEDCAFCAQSISFQTNAPIYGLKEAEELARDAESFADTPVNRFSVVTSGKRASRSTVDRVIETLSRMQPGRLRYCASLGIAGDEELQRLKAAGVSRYHHNLETARSHFPKICTTHSYDDRVQTIEAARRAGMEVCSGGIFGMGETDAQAVELALELQRLGVSSSR
jgi:biotin synthase